MKPRTIMVVMLMALLPLLSACQTSVTGKVVAEQKFGTLSVTSSPEKSYVYLDGELRGVTPTDIKGVKAGEHTLNIAAAGYYHYETLVTVWPGKTTFINVPLVQNPNVPQTSAEGLR